MTTKFKGSQQQVQALNTFIKLVRASNSVSSDCSRVITDNGLTESQFGVIEALYHLGPMPQKLLAEKILKSGGNLTMVIDNLVKNNLVQRTRRDDDRRFYWIELTDRGEELIRRIFPDHVDLITSRMSVLNHDEQIMLADLCRKVGAGTAK
jgi:MarR family 2-MHQ and catechol resistance regulon transcriptional repressor